MEFFPPKKQTEEYLKSIFIDKGLAEVVKLHKAQASHEAKRELTQVRIFNITITAHSFLGKDCTLGKGFIWCYLPKRFF